MKKPNESRALIIDCVRIRQPIGEFFIASIPFKDLIEISHIDVRRLKGERGFETYLGIQRPLNDKRVKELDQYVNTSDACFPTAVIIAVLGVCAEFNTKKSKLTLSSYHDGETEEDNVPYDQIANVIDGQHRIEGLKNFQNKSFDVNVSIFIDMDIADQAYLFSTVNLAQTKVNTSLVYDLFDLAKHRSPQKTCHNIAVALDKNKKSPFFERIKRLGVSTEGRFNETITQATLVQTLLKYISKNPLKDRSLYLEGKIPELANVDELSSLIFRNLFIEEKDLQIVDVIWNYFEAVDKRWPEAWNSSGKGIMLNKTNGFKGLMRFLRPLYLHIAKPGDVPDTSKFLNILKKIKVDDQHFDTDEYKPGTSGESKLYHFLKDSANITE